jgi:hypothetical protein
MLSLYSRRKSGASRYYFKGSVFIRIDRAGPKAALKYWY